MYLISLPNSPAERDAKHHSSTRDGKETAQHPSLRSTLVKQLIKCVAAVLAFSTFSSSQAGLTEGVTSFEKGNHSEALRELLPLAEQGVPLAQMVVAVMYSNGQGVTKDATEGMKWYLKAAEQGLAHAQVSVGNAYFLGMGAKEDSAEAIKWYSRAAAQGWTQALFNLGSMYSVGQGVSRDLIGAYKWCLLSANGTPAGGQRESAQRRCDRLKPQLSSNDIAQAKRLAAEFIPKPEITWDVAGKIYDACMRKEAVTARGAAVEYPVMHAYSICSTFAESCRYSGGGQACDEGLKRYGVAEPVSK